MDKELYIELQDTQWQFDYIDHDRNIARAIVYDDKEQKVDIDFRDVAAVLDVVSEIVGDIEQ